MRTTPVPNHGFLRLDTLDIVSTRAMQICQGHSAGAAGCPGCYMLLFLAGISMHVLYGLFC